MPDFTVELIVTVKAKDAAAAEKKGEKIAGYVERTQAVESAIVADVRSEDD